MLIVVHHTLFTKIFIQVNIKGLLTSLRYPAIKFSRYRHRADSSNY